MNNLSISKLIKIGVVAVLSIIVISMSGSIFEDVDAGEIVVIQAPISGKLTVYKEPGWVGQWFGKATHYEKSAQYWFNRTAVKEDEDIDHSAIAVRWNDAGTAKIAGSVRYKMPLSDDKIIELHSIYGSQKALENDLIETNLKKSIYMTGPLMSSKESYAEKRSDLIQLIEDQAARGVYQTIQKDIKTADPISGQEKTVTVVEIQYDTAGTTLRQEVSPLKSYGISLSNLSIESITYDSKVESQIEAQRKATMEVQTAMAKAKEAEQRALTAEKEGEARAAEAKWEQEVIAAKEVTQAEMRRKVAEEDVKTADLQKRKAILEGEGEAAKKRLVMQADGALTQKLQAWKEVQGYWADALANYKGNIVPLYQTGGSGNSGNGAMNFMEIMGMKAARDLNLDMSVQK